MRRPVAACCLLTAMLAASCAEQDGVSTYTVKNLSTRSAAPQDQPPEFGVAWFFKMLADPDTIDAQKAAFDRVVESLEFDNEGQPRWDVPEGWSQTERSGLRYATLTLDDSDPPLELTISQFPARDPAGDEYLKSNVDRWRGQLGLPPYPPGDWKAAAEEADELRTMELAGGELLLVQLEGTGTDDQPAKMLATIVPRPAAAAADADPATSPAGVVPDSAAPVYSAPEEWQPETARQFQIALWSAGEGDEPAEVSVSSAGGNLQANITRWRRQIGLNPSSTGDDVESVEEIEVGGYPATRVELNGPQKSIIGVIVPAQSQQWFFKLQGASESVDVERERFDAFLESIQFE